METLPISLDDVRAAAERLRGVAHRTPVVTSRTVNVRAGCEVFFKCENLQRGGAFKFRGAYNRLAQLTADERRRGVVAFSSGNHAQGVALAAQLLAIPAVIVMPSDAPRSKVAATRDSYGAEVVHYDREREDREAIAERLSHERGLTVVPPYDDPAIMAGQGTAGLEFLEQVDGGLDYVLAPVGGGGLISGLATAVKALSPGTRLIGVETDTSNDWEQSFQRNERVKIPVPPTIADGIRTQQPGAVTWPVVRAHVERIMTVTDDEIRQAMASLLLRMKLLVEPTGAVPAALVFSGRATDLAGKRVGVVLSGGNVDPDVLCEVLRATAGA